MARVVRLAALVGSAGALVFVVALLIDAPLEYGLDCNRFSGTCTFTQHFLTHSRVGQARIASLERAEVRGAISRHGKPPFTVWVTSRQGDWFFAGYTTRAPAQEAAERINSFLGERSRGRLVLTRSVRATYWMAWSLVPVVAVLVVAMASVFFSKRKRANSQAR